jgi:ATP-dependent DNA ligase
MKILAGLGDYCIRLSEALSDAEALLAECERRGIEGIVSKRTDAPYRPGKCDWIKVKTRAWREANRYRGELFNQR